MKKTTNIVNVDNNGEVKVGLFNRIWNGCKNHMFATGAGLALLVGGGLCLYKYLSDDGEDIGDKVAESIEKTVESVTDAISE